MKKINVFLIISILLCSILAPFSFTENVSAIEQHEVSDGTVIGTIENDTHTSITVKFYSINDSDVIDTSPDSNYNWQTMMKTYKSGYASHFYRSMVNFDISSIPSSSVVQSAILYLDCNGYGYNGYPWQQPGGVTYIHRQTSSWDEGTVTWNNQPTFNATSTDSIPINGEGWYNWNVTGDVQSFVNGTNINYGWTLKSSEAMGDSEYQDWYTKEQTGTGHDPYINIIYEIRYNVTRDVSSTTEADNFSFISSSNYTDNVNLKVPVSSNVRGIVDVTNNTGSVLATEVNSTDLLVNNTFWYDSANQFVYIRTIDLTYGMTVNWTINCSYGITFNIPIPTYKEVGDDIVMSGRILNSTGVGMNISARTHIYNSTGVDVVSPVHEWFCHYGNYQAAIPTSGLIPGVYSISIEIVDPVSGITFKYGDNLYLSFETPDGVYSDAILRISFYNTNIGLGLIPETFKVYIDDAREYDNIYYGYTGQTINITILDYYNSEMKTVEHTITETEEELNLGLTFHEYFFTNENNEYFYASFLKYNASRWYELVVPMSGGDTSFMLPTGNYTVRVYNADNSTYTVWTETVNRSKAYLIGTDGVSLIIQGQSVIVGQFLELREEFAYAFMPDVTIISRNPPMIFSIYDKEGMAFGNDFYMICPPLITIATTRVTTYGNWINSTPAVPGNGSVANGTVTIIRDVLYLSGPGSITWVNITYTANGSVFGNTSYIPSRIDIYGENLTINASSDISILRVTKFNQVRKFDWTYYPGEGYGHTPSRPGWHQAGIEIINVMSVPLYEVFAIAGFSDESNPDGSSVEVRDTTNGGVILEKGPGYDITETSVHFNLLSMNALETRAFTIGYYKLSSESYIYDEGIVSIPTYDHTVWNGDSYNTFPVHWNNIYDRTFRGALYVKIGFPVPTDIDVETMRIWDLTFDRELDRSLFIPGRNFIRISAEAIGDVLPGGSRKFDVYFLMETFPGADPRELHLDTEIFMGITPFLLILLAGIGCIIVGAALAAWDKKNKDRWKLCVSMGIFIIVIVYILNMMGM